MPFPDSPRVIYERNPLREVICQVRFPPILRIEADPPADFQERVRRGYPLFREVLQPDLPAAGVPAEIAGLVRALVPVRTRTYEFTTDNGAWTISLSRDALSLKTTSYRRWEEFRSHLEEPLHGLNDLYKPAFFLRVGLRYVDVIQRSGLGLKDRSWSELLKPHIAGEFTATELAGQIVHAARELGVKLAGDASVMIRHGLMADGRTEEAYFVIDSDFFAEQRLEPSHAIGLLNDFNRESGRLFRWCIMDALHQAMGPTAVAD